MSAAELVTMPKWGLSMDEGQIVGWHRRIGEAIVKGDDLLDVETTKITNSVEAPASGILLRILAEPGASSRCGAPIGVIGPAGTGEAEIAALLAAYEQQAAAIDPVAIAAPEAIVREIDRGGERRRVRYLDVGAGADTVLLLHGFGGDLDNWAFTLPSLVADYRVVSVDLAGHGGSDKRVGDGTAASLASDVAALLDDIAGGPIHIVAHSFGAMVGRALAGHLGRRLASFTAIAPADLAIVNAAYVDGFMAARRRPDMAAAVALLFADPAIVTREMSEDLLKFKRLDGVQNALAAIAAANFTGQRPDPAALAFWEALGPRGMVIWGSDDAIVGSTALATVPTGTPTCEIAGAGHMPHLERAAEVNAAILAHLRAQAPS